MLGNTRALPQEAVAKAEAARVEALREKLALQRRQGNASVQSGVRSRSSFVSGLIPGHGAAACASSTGEGGKRRKAADASTAPGCILCGPAYASLATYATIEEG